MNRRRICFCALIFLCGIALFADDDQENVNVVTVTGTVRLTGTGNFPQIVIKAADKEWYVSKEDDDKLFDLQHLKVTVEGEGTERELKFANGRTAGKRYELRNIKIISVDAKE